VEAAQAMRQLTASITNELTRNVLIWLLIAFLSGTLLSAAIHYVLMQHEPKELFHIREMFQVGHAPLWVALAAVQFFPIIATLVSRRLRRFQRHALAVLAGPFLMAVVPDLDPFFYSPYYTRCLRISEPDVLDVARAGLERETSHLERSTGEPAVNIAAAEVVQFVQWPQRPVSRVRTQ
jgi:hypothetical protein